jgi:5-methylcytosine-specific restriction endonuclease McrA
MDRLNTGEIPLPGIYHHLIFNFYASPNTNESRYLKTFAANNPYTFKKYYRKLKKLRRRNYYGVGIDTRKIEIVIQVLQHTHFRKYNYEWLRQNFNSTKKEAFKVLSRSGRYCQHCGTTSRLSIDHIKPLIKGGSNHLSNLQILCVSCNSKKGVTYPKRKT